MAWPMAKASQTEASKAFSAARYSSIVAVLAVGSTSPTASGASSSSIEISSSPIDYCPGSRSHTVGAHVAKDQGGLFNKIVGSQHHGSVGLGLLFEELTRCAIFDYFAQPHKLIHALIWFYAAPTFKIVHRRGANRAQNYFTLIEHRELNDRPIEVVTPDLALLQRHCK